MAIGTGWSKGTVAFTVGFADGDITGKAETEAFSEERCEGKVVVIGVAQIVRRQETRSRIAYICCHDIFCLCCVSIACFFVADELCYRVRRGQLKDAGRES